MEEWQFWWSLEFRSTYISHCATNKLIMKYKKNIFSWRSGCFNWQIHCCVHCDNSFISKTCAPFDTKNQSKWLSDRAFFSQSHHIISIQKFLLDQNVLCRLRKFFFPCMWISIVWCSLWQKSPQIHFEEINKTDDTIASFLHLMPFWKWIFWIYSN